MVVYLDGQVSGLGFRVLVSISHILTRVRLIANLLTKSP